MDFKRSVFPVSNLLIPLGSLATGPILARGLGVENRGVLAALMMIFLLTPALMNFGQQDMILVALKKGAKSGYIQSAVKFNIRISLLNFLLALIFFTFLQVQNYQHYSWNWLLVLLVPAMHLMQIPRALSIASDDEISVMVEKILQVSMRLFLLLILYSLGRLTVTSALVVHVFIVFSSSVIAFRSSIKLLFGIYFRESKEVKEYSFNPNLWIMSLILFLYGKIGQLVLLIHHDNYGLGLFVVSQVFLDVSQSASAGLKVANFSNKDILKSNSKVMTKLFRQTFFISIGVCGLIGISGNTFLSIMFGSEFIVNDYFVPLLGISVIPIFLLDFYLARYLNEILKGKLILSASVCLIFSIALVFVSYSFFGLNGLSWSTSLTWFLALGPFILIQLKSQSASTSTTEQSLS